MNKVVVSVVLSLALGMLLLGWFTASRHASESSPSSQRIGEQVASLQGEIQSLRVETNVLLQAVRNLEGARYRADEAGTKPDDALGNIQPANAPAEALADHPGDLRTYILGALQEDRTQRDAKRQQLAEAKKEETAAMKMGPYEKFNLKVNSFGKALELTDAQKQSLYVVLKQADESWREARRRATEPGNEGAAAGGSQPRGPISPAQLRQVQETVQKEFESNVQQILTAPQLESFKKLSRSAHDFQNLGKVKPLDKSATPRP